MVLESLDINSIVADPIIHYIGIALAFGVFMLSLNLRGSAGNIMRPVFTGLALLSLLSLVGHVLYLLYQDLALALFYNHLLFFASMLAMIIALDRAGSRL
jgi:putative copper export protein